MPITYNASGGEGEAYTRTMLANSIEREKLRREQQIQARRWQGAQEYQTLVQSGVEPRQALQRTAPKLFFNDPRALAGSVPSMLSQQGGLFTDPETGRRMTVDRFGTPRALSQGQFGWTTVTDEFGQTYRVPLNEQQRRRVPERSAPAALPPVGTVPGGGQFFMRPGVAPQRIIPDPTEIVTIKDTTGTEVKIRRGEHELNKAKALIADDLKKLQKFQVEAEKGERRLGPDWNPLATPYTNAIAGLTKKLEQQGFGPDGQVLPGSELAQKVFGPQGAGAAPTPSPYQMTTPPPQQYGPPLPPPTRVQVPPDLYRPPPAAVTRPITAPTLGLQPPRRRRPAPRPRPPGIPPRAPAPARQRRTVIKSRTLPDGTVQRAIFDADTREFIGNAD